MDENNKNQQPEEFLDADFRDAFGDGEELKRVFDGNDEPARPEPAEEMPEEAPEEVWLPCPGTVDFGGYTLVSTMANSIVNTPHVFTVQICGPLLVRSRRTGDALRTPGGRKSLKKLYIDRKIPCAQRQLLPVLEDETGIVAAGGIGADLNRRAAELPAWQITVIKKSTNDPKENEHAGQD